MQGRLLSQLNKVEDLAGRPRWKKLIDQPYPYLFAILFKNLIYPKTRKAINKDALLFF